eukprot:5495301-Pleurochrysis_carterae.AAC.2
MAIHFMSDGFPVTGFSLFYACILNASWPPAFQLLSESQLSCLVISRKAETISALTDIYREARISEDWHSECAPAGQSRHRRGGDHSREVDSGC